MTNWPRRPASWERPTGPVFRRRDLLSATPLALVGCDPVGLGRSNPNFRVVGHHGVPNLAPENTIPSFDAALSVGANAMEIDLCVTADETLIAFHDRDPDSPVALARQAGGEDFEWLPFVPGLDSPWRRPVSTLTLAELREYYGYRRADGGRDDSVVIPTLAEVLDWVTTKPALRAVYLDLKFDPKSEGEAAAAALREVWAAWQASETLQAVQFYFLSIHSELVSSLQQERTVLELEPELEPNPLRVVWDFEKPGALAATLSAGLRDVSTGLTPSITWSDYKQEIADIVQAREDGKIDSVLAWTFDREIDLAELLYYSVDGIITNDPSTLNRIWQDTLE